MSMLVSILLSAALLYQLLSISLSLLLDRGVVVRSRTDEKQQNVRRRNGLVVPKDTDQPQRRQPQVEAFDQDLYRPHPFHHHPLSGSSPFSLSSLSAVVMFRLFDDDTLGFALEDLRHWMDYMSYAGVQHFYVYDNCLKPTECQSSAAAAASSSFLVASPRVTYTQWSIADYQQAQVPAYNHHLQTHFPQHVFEVLLDMDEYPFMPHNPDTPVPIIANNNNDDDAAVASIRSQPNFLRNYAVAKNQDQVLMRTVFFGGIPETPPKDNNNSKKDGRRVWRVERYTHRRPKAEHDSRTKPIYKPHRVEYRSPTNLHEMTLRYQRRPSSKEGEDFQYSSYDKQMGYDMAEDESILRLNHYWCERLLDDHNTLVHDTSIQQVVQRIKS